MKKRKDEKWLDELIFRTIDSGKPQFDSEKWRTKFPEEFRILKSRAAKQPAAHQPNIWRIIMKSKITKLTAAAVMTIIVLRLMSFWPSGGLENEKWWLGSSAAWGQEIIETLDIIKGVSCRERTMWIAPDGSKHPSSTWNIFYVSSDSYRRDIYDGDTLREIQWYVPDGNDMIHHSVRFDLESYFIHRGKGSFGNHDPVERMRFYVRLLDEADKLLGEKVIDDNNCVGFEISASKYGNNPKEWLVRIWFDVDTKLPASIEHEMPCPRDKTQDGFQPHIRVQDQFDYNPELPADTFVPEIPEGFINAHPDEIRAVREKEKGENQQK